MMPVARKPYANTETSLGILSPSMINKIIVVIKSRNEIKTRIRPAFLIKCVNCFCMVGILYGESKISHFVSFMCPVNEY